VAYYASEDNLKDHRDKMMGLMLRPVHKPSNMSDHPRTFTEALEQLMKECQKAARISKKKDERFKSKEVEHYSPDQLVSGPTDHLTDHRAVAPGNTGRGVAPEPHLLMVGDMMSRLGNLPQNDEPDSFTPPEPDHHGFSDSPQYGTRQASPVPE
jgi:hypothetical protein